MRCFYLPPAFQRNPPRTRHAPAKRLSLALPSNIEVKTHTAIESLEMGFLPVSGLTGKSGATYLNPKEPEFRLDFLTVSHRAGEEIFTHPQLNIPLQPLKFMEFSLEKIQHAALFSTGNAVLINVPHPARYALHKLLVYGEREGAFAAKSSKDLQQAASLLAYYREHGTWDIDEAWTDLISRGKVWRRWIAPTLNSVQATGSRCSSRQSGRTHTTTGNSPNRPNYRPALKPNGLHDFRGGSITT